MFRFEKLDVWHRAVAHACNAYRVTKESPAEERFGLTSQLRRASVSIAANLAEGVAVRLTWILRDLSKLRMAR